QPDITLNEPPQEILEQPIDESQQQELNQNFESANSCMGDSNAKNQETSNAESPPLKDKLVPKTVPETETVVEEAKVAE
ncbi:hypothetical protein A2U01_0064879, partial [Trifolium medium]|nr:hypothetical protein [Trifolium medium]